MAGVYRAVAFDVHGVQLESWGVDRGGVIFTGQLTAEDVVSSTNCDRTLCMGCVLDCA